MSLPEPRALSCLMRLACQWALGIPVSPLSVLDRDALHTPLSHDCWRAELGSSCLLSRHFTDWPHSVPQRSCAEAASGAAGASPLQRSEVTLGGSGGSGSCPVCNAEYRCEDAVGSWPEKREGLEQWRNWRSGQDQDVGVKTVWARTAPSSPSPGAYKKEGGVLLDCCFLGGWNFCCLMTKILIHKVRMMTHALWYSEKNI